MCIRDSHPPGRQYKLRARCKGFFKNVPRRRLVKGELYNPGTVAQVNKNQLAQVALALNPAAGHHFAAHVLHPKFAAVMRALQAVHCLCHIVRLQFYSTL